MSNAANRELEALIFDPEHNYPERGVLYSFGPFRLVAVANLTNTPKTDPRRYMGELKRENPGKFTVLFSRIAAH